MKQDWLAVTDYSEVQGWLLCLDNRQCLLDFLHFGLKGRAPNAGRDGTRMETCRIARLASIEQDASSIYCCTVRR